MTQQAVGTLEQAQLILNQAAESLSGFAVNTVAPQTEGKSAIDLAILQAKLKEAHEAAEDIKSTLGKVYDWVRTIALPERMDEEGLETMKVVGVGRVSLTADLHAFIKDKETGYQWLEDHGHGDLVTETVNAASLKALLRRMMRDGQEIPEDIFKVTPFTRASITKA